MENDEESAKQERNNRANRNPHHRARELTLHAANDSLACMTPELTATERILLQKIVRCLAGLAILALLCGCEARSELAKSQSKPKTSRWAKGSEAAAKEKAKAGPARAVPREGTRPSGGYPGGDGGSSSFASSPSGSAYSGAARSDGQAIEQIGKSIRESLDLGPTLVVWVIDRSDSASRLAHSAITAIGSLYASDDFRAAAADDKLLSAVVGFGETTDLLLDPPSSDAAKVKAALDAAKSEPGSREGTFAALKLALEKYLPLRTKERREVLLAVVTDEPGDDIGVLEDVVSLVQKNAIPVFVIGPGVPLGKASAPPPPAVGPKPTEGPDKRTYAADSLFPDWISFNSGAFVNNDSQDSGFGPWALERLCRESSGSYLAVGSVGSQYGMRVDPKVMSKFAPDYASKEAIDKLLAENKCRAALVKAVQMPPAPTGLMNPQTIFPKRNEAEMKRILDKAQLDAARLEPEINKVYDALTGENGAAENDRPKLTGLRWQVAYDTALGRAAAAKVRIDGYNAMLAALKRGKNFEKEGSTTWVLEPADTIETGSAMQKLADKAKSNLERIKTDYPGTPWARVAEEELRTAVGWKWIEQ